MFNISSIVSEERFTVIFSAFTTARKISHSVIQIVVDYDIIIIVSLFYLARSLAHTLVYDLGSFGATLFKAVAEGSQRWRENEHEHSIGAFFLDLHSALHFNFKYNVLALFKLVENSLAGSAVVVAAVAGVLKHTVFSNELLEALLGEKMVVHAVNLALSWGTGGSGYGIVEIIIFEHLCKNSALSAA